MDSPQDSLLKNKVLLSHSRVWTPNETPELVKRVTAGKRITAAVWRVSPSSEQIRDRRDKYPVGTSTPIVRRGGKMLKRNAQTLKYILENSGMGTKLLFFL